MSQRQLDVRFHNQALVEFLQQSPSAERMAIPQPHLQPRVGGPDWMSSKRKRQGQDAKSCAKL